MGAPIFFRRDSLARLVSGEVAQTTGYSSLARNLEALGSTARLEILHALRTPKALHEIHVMPAVTRPGESRERPLSRQGVTRHLDQLVEIGLVNRASLEETARREAFVLNHERLFALVDEIRGLAKLRPTLASPTSARTIDRRTDRATRLPDAPRLVVAYGRDDGVGYALSGGAGTKWRVGRSRECEIRLDYDPYVSSTNSILERSSEGFVLQDVPTSRNGTMLNWAPMRRGSTSRLAPGDVVGVGRSILVFQEPRGKP
jgi:DNA-binding transcriptional ArsR family regulator